MVDSTRNKVPWEVGGTQELITILKQILSLNTTAQSLSREISCHNSDDHIGYVSYFAEGERQLMTHA